MFDFDLPESWYTTVLSLATIIVLYTIFRFIISVFLKFLLGRAKTKRQISNIKILSQVFSYIILLIIIIFTLSAYEGIWAQLSLGIGLLSAALGFALQRPISGIAAWFMIVTKRPFEIGDRIIVNGVSGDVVDMHLTHIKIKEIGGIVAGEENSGRTVLVPNSILFEQNIINYTYAHNTHILDQITFTITFDSNLERAKAIAIDAATEILSKVMGRPDINPYTLAYFDPHGMKINLRYFAPANNLQQFSSDISQLVFSQIKDYDDIKLAHPHLEVFYNKSVK